MVSELVTTSSPENRPTTSEVATVGERRYALADVATDDMTTLMHMPSELEMARSLQRGGVPKDAVLKPGDNSANISALSNYMLAFFPTVDIVHFALALLAAMHALFRAKQMGDEEYRRYFFATSMLRKNKTLLPLPSCIRELFNGIFVLCGASGSGKSSFIRQFAARLPKPFLMGKSPIASIPSLQGVWVFPVLRLLYPACGTVWGLVQDMRHQFIASVGSVEMDEEPLSDMLAREPENAAITACIAMNVGLVVLDGAGIHDSNQKTARVLAFLLKLRELSGIPIVLSCTAAFLKSIEHHQTLYANLTNGLTLHLEPLDPPSPRLLDGTVPDDGDAWRHMCKCWWSAGLVPKDVPMPAMLEDWTYELALGNARFGSTAFHGLHKDMATSGDVDYAALTKEYVQSVMEESLFASRGARNAIKVLNTPSSAIPSNAINYVDYFPTSIVEEPRVADWVVPQKQRGKR